VTQPIIIIIIIIMKSIDVSIYVNDIRK